MRIIKRYPPNIAAIDAKFHIMGQPIAFTYGDTIYMPMGGELIDHVQHHEEFHMKQQAELGVELWWKRYLESEDFRLNEELLAYREQWEYVRQHYNRARRRSILEKLSKDLSSPMYGNVVDKKRAQELIENKTALF